MGIRRTALETIITLLDNLAIIDDSQHVITVVNTLFDFTLVNRTLLPRFSCVPAPETIQLDLYGTKPDSTYLISLIGYVPPLNNAGLFATSEDVIESIVRELTDPDNVDTFCGLGFSITNIGPILNEQWDEDGNLAYVSIMLTVQFVQ